MDNMDSSVNKGTSEGHKDVAFDSKDIITKTKAGQKKEYFVKFKDKTVKQKSSEWFAKNKKKIIITVCAIIIAAAAVFAAIMIISAINQPKKKDVTEINEEISGTEDSINQYLDDMQNSDSNTPLTDTIEHFEELYDQETDPDKKFALLVAQIRYLTDKRDFDEAEKLVALAQMPNLSDEQKYIYNIAIYKMYVEKGDMDMANIYYSIAEQLPDEAKPNDGGGA